MGFKLLAGRRRAHQRSRPRRPLLSLSRPAITASALDAGLRVADTAQIYADVPRDYTLSELCIMSRFRPITPEDRGGGGIEAIVSTACVSHQRLGGGGGGGGANSALMFGGISV